MSKRLLSDIEFPVTDLEKAHLTRVNKEATMSKRLLSDIEFLLTDLEKVTLAKSPHHTEFWTMQRPQAEALGRAKAHAARLHHSIKGMDREGT